MGANESRESVNDDNNKNNSSESIVKILFDFFVFISHLVFVIVSKSLFSNSRSLSTNDAEHEGLQSEIVAANKDGEAVRMRLRYQDSQLEKLKESQDLEQDTQSDKYSEYFCL
jgi:hypothetical protein